MIDFETWLRNNIERDLRYDVGGSEDLSKEVNRCISVLDTSSLVHLISDYLEYIVAEKIEELELESRRAISRLGERRDDEEI